MSDYKNDRFAHKPFHKGGSRFGATKEMYKAECSKCGRVCEVPFRPNGKKPVFCSNCFVKDSADAPRGPRHEYAPRPSFHTERLVPREDQAFKELKAELRGVNEKLERLIRAVEVSRAVESAVASAKPAAKKRVSTKKA